MKTLLLLLFWTLLGVVGLKIGLAGNPVGWLFLASAVWSITATMRQRNRRDDGKEGHGDGGGGFNVDIGGCGGCGGCGG